MEIEGDFQALNAEGRRLGSIAEGLDHGVARITARVQELLSGGWTGAAAHDFEVAFTDWVSAAESAVANLRGLSDAVRGTAADMAMTEQAHQNRVHSLSGELEPSPLGPPTIGPSLGFGELMGRAS